jgi:prolyl-tRNA synthetase
MAGMRASRLHIVTYREDPADAEVPSHRLMARAGLIHKLGSGLYVYAPLLWRTLNKAMAVVREEMNALGALETQLPILQDSALWLRSGRWPGYMASGTMLTTTDRKGTTYGLAPTAEEVVTEYVGATVKSYKQLPVTIYQVHTKFRDELRPRFGLLRVKEFLMKDAYSFDVDDDGLDASYKAMEHAYHGIFRRLGLSAFGVDADPGDIGGSGSMEFMLAAETGEDAILVEPGTTYAANVEKASSRFAAPWDEDARALRIEDTPGVRSCEELHTFFPDVPVDRMVKTLLFKATYADRDQLWAVLIRGDQEVNEVKLRNHTGALDLGMLDDDEIAEHTGAAQGFAGPIGLSDAFLLVADETVRGMCNLLCGLNSTDQHALDVAIGRDFSEPEYADLRLAREGEPGPIDGAALELRRGIEAGHIFKLGTKYSAAMGATFMDASGREKPFVMGCYGIGVSRIVAGAVEQHHDEQGIKWPVALAPYEVVVACLTPKKADVLDAAEATYEMLRAGGVDVLFDDRKLSPGAKMKDLELIGFPVVVLVGRSWAQDGVMEVRVRATGETERVSPDAVGTAVASQLAALRG